MRIGLTLTKICIVFGVICRTINAQNLADWMSGNHGVGFRIPGGVNMESAVYDVE